ncbi:SIR2 family protein [Promicromonospora sp. NPDC057138]|uniref:SIR2 family protein n=1 Tax=Promicromonospora sp. NPDC057138 TaxID=3346031 RepID=UPI0036452A32
MTTDATSPSIADHPARTQNERGSSYDPVLTLASTMDATPDAYAVLLGAGISVSAGVLSAWGVQEHLIERLANLDGADLNGQSPHSWYQSRFGQEATYESLLEEQGTTQHARQALLREIFEPQTVDSDVPAPLPSAAHRALARLAASGHVRVFLTLNFDHLMETALRDEGISPYIVHSPTELAALGPLHTIPAVVVHLHGDYLTPTAMKNTASELADYEPELQSFLARVLSDYALLVVGWSAEYDVALRTLIDKHLLLQYTSYWINRGELEPAAADFARRNRIVHVTGTADEKVGRLADAVAAISDRQARHPLSLAEAVVATKRDLAGLPVAVNTHDRLRRALSELREHEHLNQAPHDLEKAHTYGQVFDRLTEATLIPAGLVAAAAYWGNETTDAWWFDDLRRFTSDNIDSAGTSFVQLPRLCGTLLYQAALVGSVATGRFELAQRLLHGSAELNYGRSTLLPERLLAASNFVFPSPPSARAFETLQPIFVEHLALGQRAYQDAWELADILGMVEFLTAHPSWHNHVTELGSAQAVLDTAQGTMAAVGAGTAPAVHPTEARADLAAASQDRDRKVGRVADLLDSFTPHVRGTMIDFERAQAPTAERLLVELQREGATHPLLRAGLATGKPIELQAALAAVSVSVGRAFRKRHNSEMTSSQRRATEPLARSTWIDTGAPST